MAMARGFRRSWSIACFCLLACVGAIIDENEFASRDILHYDVCVIGGGSAGTYAAIRLRDLKKTVAVVEAKGRLGGHTETYTDPISKATIDIGVIEFHNLDLVRNYFGRFDIPLDLISFEAPGVTIKYVDFQTGKAVDGYTPPNVTAALGAYAAQLAKYPYLYSDQSLGHVPQPVPADLLLSFGDFIEKYSLQNAVFLFSSYGQGLGNILKLPTLYALKLISPALLQDLQIGSLNTKRHDNSELYEKAQAELGADALLNSHVLAMDRSSGDCAKILIQTPAGRKLIRAKKIVSTIPPILSNLQGFDLDNYETPLFSQFKYHSYYAGILKNSGIPDDLSLINVGTNTPYNLPVLPAAYDITPTSTPGLHLFQSTTNDNQRISDEQMEYDVVASIKRMRAAGALPSTNESAPQFAIFSSHTPFEVYVPARTIATGFYNRLFALQGKKNTYWTGAAFVTHDSTLIWQYTETLLAQIAA